MHSKIHAIALDPSKCVGCTNCLKCCPTEAIRVKSGHSKIVKERCINCGQCIQACPRRARFGVTDDLSAIQHYQYKIALVDPVLYGQFHEIYSPSQILKGILKLGFDNIFEISQGADLITEFTRNFIAKSTKFPIISSSCPTIVRLIQIRFPELIDHILPFDSPVEISAHLARKDAMEQQDLNEEDIGVFYISPCPAKIYSFQKPVGIKKSRVTGTLSVKSVFLEISKTIEAAQGTISDFYSSGRGIGWARSGGQSQALAIKEFLAVDGIQNVISVLEEIEYHKINDLTFVECHACTNGCVGGSLNIENSFVARNRIRRLVEQYAQTAPRIHQASFEEYRLTEPLLPIQVIKLDEDISEAIKKMESIERVLATLPNIDCGACGSPSCRALAEDIVLGYAKADDCIVKLRHRLEKSNQ
ncbi:[Fe-Fe] hydrogenase large subunit C-terminal domain-containing protein [Alkaliphilus crotonatoxidans]